MRFNNYALLPIDRTMSSHILSAGMSVCATDEGEAYVETLFRDITGPHHLVEWWKSWAPSLFKDHVLSPITMSMAKFASFAKYRDTDQSHSL